MSFRSVQGDSKRARIVGFCASVFPSLRAIANQVISYPFMVAWVVLGVSLFRPDQASAQWLTGIADPWGSCCTVLASGPIYAPTPPLAVPYLGWGFEGFHEPLPIDYAPVPWDVYGGIATGYEINWIVMKGQMRWLHY